MAFRRIVSHRVLLEDVSNDTEKGDDAPTTNISFANCESVTQFSDIGAKVRVDRSGTRRWNMPPDDYVKSTAPKTLAKINDCLQPDDINDQVLIRINKDSIEKNDTIVELADEPTPGGIHQDGCEITTVTFINRLNCLVPNLEPGDLINQQETTKARSLACLIKILRFLSEIDLIGMTVCSTSQLTPILILLYSMTGL
jgi:hypothetical protein